MGVPRVPVPHCRVVLGPETPVAFGCSRGKNLNNGWTSSSGQSRPVYLLGKYVLRLHYVPGSESGLGEPGMRKT